MRIVYREHRSAWSEAQAKALKLDWQAPIEHVVDVVRIRTDHGNVTMLTEDGNTIKCHWTDVKNYFPERPGYF